MSSCVEIDVIVEGPAEQQFIKQVLAHYIAARGVYLTPSILNKPGQKGGDVKFARAKNDIRRCLKQRQDTWVTLMVDYYGIKSDWPGYENSKQQTDHKIKAEVMNQATAEEVQKLFPEENRGERFIPYVSMHEIEALYFSDPEILANGLSVKQKDIEKILADCGEPEKINDHYTTAPSKRLEALSSRYTKTSTGISIAKVIGIDKMRAKCPIFNAWLEKLESLARRDHGEA